MKVLGSRGSIVVLPLLLTQQILLVAGYNRFYQALRVLPDTYELVCPNNEDLQTTVPCCEPTCDNDCSKISCPAVIVRRPTCVCKPEYVRYKGKCMNKQKCPERPPCPVFCDDNEELLPSPPCCEPSCTDDCSDCNCRTRYVDQPTCVCKKGFRRNKGKCVRVDQCPSCGPYATLRSQAPCCEPSCENDCSDVLCLPSSGEPRDDPVCVCQDGYVKHNNTCMRKELCPKRPLPQPFPPATPCPITTPTPFPTMSPPPPSPPRHYCPWDNGPKPMDKPPCDCCIGRVPATPPPPPPSGCGCGKPSCPYRPPRDPSPVVPYYAIPALKQCNVAVPGMGVTPPCPTPGYGVPVRELEPECEYCRTPKPCGCGDRQPPVPDVTPPCPCSGRGDSQCQYCRTPKPCGCGDRQPPVPDVTPPCPCSGRGDSQCQYCRTPKPCGCGERPPTGPNPVPPCPSPSYGEPVRDVGPQCQYCRTPKPCGCGDRPPSGPGVTPPYPPPSGCGDSQCQYCRTPKPCGCGDGPPSAPDAPPSAYGSQEQCQYCRSPKPCGCGKPPPPPVEVPGPPRSESCGLVDPVPYRYVQRPCPSVTRIPDQPYLAFPPSTPTPEPIDVRYIHGPNCNCNRPMSAFAGSR